MKRSFFVFAILTGITFWSSAEALRPERYSFDADYLFWKIRDSAKPIDLVDSGTLDNPATSLILGGKRTRNDWRSGAKFSGDVWFDNDSYFGLQAVYFFLPTDSYSKTVYSSGQLGSPYLTIPYYDVTIPGNTYTNLSYPGSYLPYSGTATLKVVNQMQGAEMNVLRPIRCNRSLDLTFITGFRFWYFKEKLKFLTDSPYTDHSDVFYTKDSFESQNYFYGPQLGIGLDYPYKCLTINVNGKIALGGIRKDAIIDGSFVSTDLSTNGTLEYYTGGYFALPTNMGHHRRIGFSAVPELNFNVEYKTSSCFSIKAAYSFLYVSNMLWAANEMSRKINPTQCYPIAYTENATLVGQPAPKVKFKPEGLWVHGLSIILDYVF